MNMDIRTMIVVLAVLTACSALVIFFIHKHHFSVQGTLYWVYGSFIIACSLILLALRGILPDFITIVFANTATAYGFSIALSGIRLFVGRSSRLKITLIFPLILAPLLFWYSQVDPSFAARTILVSLMLGAFSGATAWELLRDAKGGDRQAQRFAGYVAAAYTAISLIRIVLAFVYLPASTLLKPGPVTVGIYLWLLAFVLLFTSGIIAMIAEKLQTEQKKGKEALQKSENQLRTIIDHSNELFYIHDAEHVLTYVSPTSETILGYTPEEIKKKWIELATDNPINLKGVEITENAIKTGKKQKPYLLELEKKDGTFVLLEVDESPVKDATGKIVGISGAARDVTLQKQNEDRLIKSEQRFRDLFNAINDVIYTHDLEGRLTSVNPAMCKVFGYEEDKLIGRRVSDFMKPEFAPTYISEYLEPIKKHGRQEGTTIYLKSNGEKVYLEYKSVLVQPEDGEPSISGTGRDITEKVLSERKVANLQEQVIQSQKMESIGTLAGGIAHDFNNILFPILGYTQMLLRELPEGSRTHSNLEKIYAGAIRARDLVRQILTFSRHGTMKLKLIKIQPVIKEALMLIRSTIPTTIDIKQDIITDCGLIKADPTQIHQIIMNLLTNSYHAMEDSGGKLKIALKEVELGEYNGIIPDMTPGIYACLTIADTGIGMDKNLIKKIFDPFFTTKEQGKGTGMGLSVVHGIVNSMGGTIRVYSEPGKGSEFNVYLPVENSFSEGQSIQSKEPIQGGNEQILLVDDEDAILTMERQALECLGYQVTSRTSSLEALEAFRANPDRFDMVITDLAMPNMPGNKLAVELIKIRSDIPILLCTGFSETMSKERAASIGIKDFLMKPIAMDDLSQKIREVLDNELTEIMEKL